MRLITAHHGDCSPFRADIFRVGPLQLCVGCFTTFPLASLLLGLLLYLHVGVWWQFLSGGILVGSVQILAVVGWTTSRARKIQVKAALGVGIAAGAYGLLMAPWPVLWKVACLTGVAIAAMLLMTPRALRMRRTCEACFYRADWERCIGFQLIAPPRALPPEKARIRGDGTKTRAPSPID